MNAPLPFSVVKQLELNIHEEMIIDLFAGGGGNSVGIEEATGRRVDVAINHDEDALSMHEANHPETLHLREDIRDVDPRAVTQGRAVGLLHLSPDCTSHSQSKGGQPRSKKSRGLTWQGLKWAGTVSPRVITLENVKQILDWGPLIAKRDKATGRVMRLDGTIAGPGERVPLREQFLIPEPRRAGAYWKKYVQSLRIMGYAIDWKIICAADQKTPTTRERLFKVARRDQKAIVWPEATHSKTGADGKPKWRAAAEIIDWSIPCPSIFTRKKPLADATLRRISKGIKRFVLDNADPFIVPLTHQGGARVHDINDPLRTVTAAHRGELALVNPSIVPIAHYNGRDIVHSVTDPLRTITAATKGGEFSLMAPILVQAGHGEGKPGAKRWSHGSNAITDALGTIVASGGGQALAAATLVQTGYGERDGQSPRTLDLSKPLGTIVAGAVKHAPVLAYLAQQNGGFNETPGHDARDPMSTITNRGSQQQVIAAHLATLRHHSTGHGADEPVATLSAGGEHHAVIQTTLAEDAAELGLTPEQTEGALRVASFLMRYYGEGGQLNDARDPVPTITTKDRIALVTVTLKGTPYVIVDIGLRMLSPKELYAAQGFPAWYIFERGHDGRVFSKSAQVRMVGNSVCPAITAALIRANLPELCINKRQRQRKAA